MPRPEDIPFIKIIDTNRGLGAFLVEDREVIIARQMCVLHACQSIAETLLHGRYPFSDLLITARLSQMYDIKLRLHQDERAGWKTRPRAERVHRAVSYILEDRQDLRTFIDALQSPDPQDKSGIDTLHEAFDHLSDTYWRIGEATDLYRVIDSPDHAVALIARNHMVHAGRGENGSILSVGEKRVFLSADELRDSLVRDISLHPDIYNAVVFQRR